MRRISMVAALAGVAVGIGGCVPLETPGSTSKIEFVSTSTIEGYKFDLYRNTAYPCSISGYQTFVIGTKVGSSDTASRPLWVRMRGGGVGFFAANGTPQPSAANKNEEGVTGLTNQLRTGLVTRVRDDASEFRFVSVSMCNHDIYAGGVQPDPNNPNTMPDGKPRTVNGLFATKAAIQFARAKYPTSKYFLHGTSAGGFGTWHVAWSLQRQGIKPDGVVSDAGVLNQRWQLEVEGPCARSDTELNAVKARIHPDVTNPNNEPDQLLARASLTAPILHVWSRGDNNTCGQQPMTCPQRDGTSPTLGSTDCVHEPVRRVIAAQGPTSKSLNMRLCVSPPTNPGSCAIHTPTNDENVNTDPGFPADYNTAAMEWVRTRLAD